MRMQIEDGCGTGQVVQVHSGSLLVKLDTEGIKEVVTEAIQDFVSDETMIALLRERGYIVKKPHTFGFKGI